MRVSGLDAGGKKTRPYIRIKSSLAGYIRLSHLSDPVFANPCLTGSHFLPPQRSVPWDNQRSGSHIIRYL
jgi:hypothetical protein